MLFTLGAALAFSFLASTSPLSKRDTNVLIVSNRDALCLTIDRPRDGPGTEPPVVTNGTRVITAPCIVSYGWDINGGSGSIILHGTDFVLDAGINPHNNGGLKLWKSFPGLYQQTWYYTNDNRIAITDGDQCLDEALSNAQTYKCTTGNTNQIWFTEPLEQ